MGQHMIWCISIYYFSLFLLNISLASWNLYNIYPNIFRWIVGHGFWLHPRSWSKFTTATIKIHNNYISINDYLHNVNHNPSNNEIISLQIGRKLERKIVDNTILTTCNDKWKTHPKGTKSPLSLRKSTQP